MIQFFDVKKYIFVSSEYEGEKKDHSLLQRECGLIHGKHQW